nr:uncharacterized protein LOC109181465 [Ipomoea trifida]
MLQNMADGEGNLQEALKPFYQRASDAEVCSLSLSPFPVLDRLARLEASLASKNNSGNEELATRVQELQSKLEDAKVELAVEKERALKEAQQLTAENAKLQYRIIHLVRALKQADCKIASNQGRLLTAPELPVTNFVGLPPTIEDLFSVSDVLILNLFLLCCYGPGCLPI